MENMTEEYTGNKLYKVMYGETVSYLCADSTAPINGVEITQEEWDRLEIELKERKENAQAQIEELTREPEPTEQLYTLDEAATILAQEVSA